MYQPKLLSRDDFREGVFARDGYKCVFCDKPAQDAHHIIERRLWPDGGFYLDNGASVCSEHHIECEMTLISVEEIRAAAGIKTILVPDVLYEDQSYDKWGNPIQSDGRRSRGPLFYEDGVQKVLAEAGVLDLFDHYVKAGKTMHLPWSPGIHSDDRVIRNLDAFEGQEVVVTVKKDGENTSMYSDHIHARSIDSASHPSRSWVKAFHAAICHDIPEKWRITGENVFAQHSIAYDNLDSYFFGFGVWNERNIRLDWDDMLQWFDLLGIAPVPTLYRGPWDEKVIRGLWDDSMYDTMEGYVVTTVKGYPYAEYHQKVAKFVRSGHVQTNKHWRSQAVIPNKLKGT